MTVAINLLPDQYIQNRRRQRRFRVCLVIGSILLGAELFTGLILHARAEQTRRLYAAAEDAKTEKQQVQKKLVNPTREAALLAQQVAMATRLRTTHHWSRLLGMVSQQIPEKVVLTTLATDPPRWSMSLHNAIKSSQKAKNPTITKKLIEGVMLRGFAADHKEMADLMSTIYSSGAFENIETKEAQRDRYLENDAIRFELKCRW